MAKKKTNKQPWSSSLESREALYKGVNPSADFDPISIATQTIGYLGGFRTGQGMPEDEARWAAYLGLPYDKTYAPDTKIRFEGDEDYPNRQYQGLSKRAKKEVREKIIPQAKRIKDKYNKEWIQVLDTKPDSEYNDATIYHNRQNYLGDLGKFGIREVGESGIYEVGDKYDFPALIPIPNRNEGTELMVRDTIWSDRANPKLYEEELLRRSNKHSIGGLLGKLGDWNTNITNSMFTNSSTGQATGFGKFAKGFGIKAGNIGGLANTAATAIGGALAGGRTTGVGNALQGIGSLASNIPGVGGLIGAGVNLIGGGVNALFGSKLNEENIATVEGDIKQALNFTSNAGNYDALASNYAGLQGVMGFDKDFIGKDSWLGKKRAKNKFNSLKEQAEEAEAHQLLALTNNAQNIADTNLQLLEANYNAYGGPIDMKYTGVISPFGNQFKDGGIYIKPSKRGTFTAAAKKRGMGVQEFASKVLANKEDYSPAMVNKANFAKNASKWKHADGGPLGEENLSLEDFIAQKINEKRAAALDKSRNRTSVRIPMVPNKRPIDVWEGLLNNDIEYAEESLSRAMAEGNKKLAALRQEELDSYLKEKDKGYPKLVPGANCMYNAGDCYGLNIPGNQTFVAKHKELGFKKAPKGSMEPGDIVQDVRGGTPIHAMIYDGKDTEGNLLFNYARGNGYADLENGYVKQGKYPLPIKDYDVYKYVGTPADSTQWINEYKEMYNKKAEGGNLFTNGVTFINNGDTHENNPLEGVRIGVDENNIPNLVEEGEVIYDDYVFSNRLRVPKEVRQKYKLRGVTFADAAKQLQKESEERPNDPISKKGLEASMKMLMSEQEMIRDKKENNKYAKGGRVNKCAEGSWLYKPVTPGFTPSKDDILAEMEDMYPSLLGESMLPIASKIEGSTAFKDQLGIKEEEQNSKVAPMKTHWLRYAPIVGSGLAVANDLFGGNEPDYSNANMFERAIEGTNRPIRARQIGNYLTYRPFDRNYYINTLNANTAAARRAAVNTSGGNRAAAMAGVLASDYNYGNQLGALARQAEEYNLAQRQAVEQFNRGTNVTNAEMAMKADMANVEQAMQRARMYGSLAEYRDAIRAKNRAEKSANLTNFIQSLGNLGTELTDKDKLRWLADLGVLKYDDEGKYTGKKSNESSNGGRITRKKRGGFTI